MGKIVKFNSKQKTTAKSNASNYDLAKVMESLNLEEEFGEMPEEMHEMVFELVKKLAEMSEEEREQVLDEMDQYAEFLDNMMEDDDDDMDDMDKYDYPHFLPRQNVQKYTLRVTLRGLTPAIYRKFCVPSNITLRHLSELLLELMGWEDEHLNQFRKGKNYYSPAYQREGEDDFMMGWGSSHYNQEDYTLSEVLFEKGKTLEWEYDFGDSWYHDIRLSSIGDYKDDEPLVSFVKGERACPPEDCGGIWGYDELLDIRTRFTFYTLSAGKKPKRDEIERLRWYDMDKNDPEFFDTENAKEICEDFCY